VAARLEGLGPAARCGLLALTRAYATLATSTVRTSAAVVPLGGPDRAKPGGFHVVSASIVELAQQLGAQGDLTVRNPEN